MPFTSNFIWTKLESNHPYYETDTFEKHDAVVVLSGMISALWQENEHIPQWSDPDRFFAGLELLQAGKADFIIFTRGKVPWSHGPPEGELLKLKAIEFGVSPNQILISGMSANTEEEARSVASLLRQRNMKNVILVTSSFHMTRAKFIFDNFDISTTAFATDHRSGEKKLNWLSFIPNADAFMATSSGLREFQGRLYYLAKYLFKN